MACGLGVSDGARGTQRKATHEAHEDAWQHWLLDDLVEHGANDLAAEDVGHAKADAHRVDGGLDADLRLGVRQQHHELDGREQRAGTDARQVRRHAAEACSWRHDDGGKERLDQRAVLGLA